MNEKPLERLNYFNGQRLQAADLKLEQDYHIRVRRWLNRSLYSSGIAEGLAVYAIKDKPLVRVTPGLAIDPQGREIILLEEQILPVVGGHHEFNGKCDGPYLSIRYSEDIVGKEESGCSIGSSAAHRAAWGGPGRILTQAVLEFTYELPNEASGRVPLACLTFAPGCGSVQAVDAGVRRYIGEASVNKVKQYALEGVRDLDGDNPATIVFHVRGRQPTAVILYLQSEQFPTMFYSEMGHHTHVMHVGLVGADGTHRHELGTYETQLESAHTHPLGGPYFSAETLVPQNFFLDLAATFAPVGGVRTAISDRRWDIVVVPVKDYTFDPPDLPDGTVTPAVVITSPPETNLTILTSAGQPHLHTFGSQPGAPQYTITGDLSSSHTHAFSQRSNDPAGVDDASTEHKFSARAGDALTFIEGLELEIDKVPVTGAVLAQINSNSASTAWTKIGSGLGGENDPLAASGTGAIRVDFLVPIGEGQHTIKLWMPKTKSGGKRNGGRIHFNLYVE